MYTNTTNGKISIFLVISTTETRYVLALLREHQHRLLEYRISHLHILARIAICICLAGCHYLSLRLLQSAEIHRVQGVCFFLGGWDTRKRALREESLTTFVGFLLFK